MCAGGFPAEFSANSTGPEATSDKQSKVHVGPLWETALTLPETNSKSPLKMDAWKTFAFPIGVSAYFQGHLLLVSRRVTLRNFEAPWPQVPGRNTQEMLHSCVKKFEDKLSWLPPQINRGRRRLLHAYWQKKNLKRVFTARAKKESFDICKCCENTIYPNERNPNLKPKNIGEFE